MKPIIVMLVLTVAIAAGCASQQDMHNLDSQVDAVKQQSAQELEDLDSQLAASREEVQQMRHQAAKLRATVDQMSEEMAKLRGGIGEMEHQLNQKVNALENAERGRQAADQKHLAAAAAMQARILQLEAYLNLSADAAEGPDTVPPAAEKAKEPKAALSDKDMYTLAKQAYDNGSYETARQGFEALIKAYPKSAQADNAQFWIGEIYYREKWYEKAILEYHKVIKNYPKGNKVPAALLKQGFAFTRLKDDASARLVLNELVKKFPKTNEAAIARRKLKAMK
jgi:tol-pal system protein YbgF